MFNNVFWKKQPPGVSAYINTGFYTRELQSYYALFLSMNNLSVLLDLSSNVFQPFIENKNACTIVLLVNMAQPEWLAIDCNKSYLTYALGRDIESQKAIHIYNCVECQQKVCYENAVVNNGSCYNFIWFDILFPGLPLMQVCDRRTMLRQVVQNTSALINVLKGVDFSFPPLLTLYEYNSSLVSAYKFQKFMNEFSAEILPVAEALGFVICMQTTKPVGTFGNLLSCSNSTFVSIRFWCDGVVDCPYDDTDERNCTCKKTFQQGDNVTLQRMSEVMGCKTLYFTGPDGQNFIYAPSTNMTGNNTVTDKVVCMSGKAILESQWDDLVPDCGPDAQDEPKLRDLLTGNTIFACSDANQIPCRPGHSVCYNISDTCSFLFDHNFFLMPCRNGGHIHDCELFECNMKFKCSQSYCVPQSYLCNGRWDCPHGHDEDQESCKNLVHCVGMLKCKQTLNTCVHLGSICNGFLDCEQGEDESLCELEYVKCPKDCDCLALAIHCESIFPFFLLHNNPFLAVSIFNSSTAEEYNILAFLSGIRHFAFSNSSFEQICGLELPNSVISLSLQFNHISELEKCCLNSLYNLMKVHLDYNKIAVIQSYSFTNLPKLKSIGLSYNPISSIAKDFVSKTSSLEVLFLQHIQLTFLSKLSFDSVFPRVVVVTNYSLCCVIPANATCTSTSPWYVSCKQVFSGELSRIVSILASVILVVLGIISFALNKFAEQSNETYEKISYFLCAVDLICSVFLTILWIRDSFLSENMMNTTFWKNSVSCKVSFLLIFSFVIFTQLSSLLLATSRLMVVVHPMEYKFKKGSFVIKCIACLIGLGCTVSFSIALTAALTMQEIPNSICSPFADPTKSAIFVTFIVVFTTVTQCTSGIVITVLHILLVCKLRKRQQAVARSNTIRNAGLITQVSLLSASFILCWHSTNAVNLTMLFSERFPLELIDWTTVLVMPLYSFLTSLILNGNLAKKHCESRQKKSKKVQTITRKR